MRNASPGRPSGVPPKTPMRNGPKEPLRAKFVAPAAKGPSPLQSRGSFAILLSASPRVFAARHAGRLRGGASPPDPWSYPAPMARGPLTSVRRGSWSMMHAEDMAVRALLVAVVKAKLVAVEDNISTLEREFVADLVLPNGQTMHEWARPQLA
jgi:hypothetical protein